MNEPLSPASRSLSARVPDELGELGHAIRRWFPAIQPAGLGDRSAPGVPVLVRQDVVIREDVRALDDPDCTKHPSVPAMMKPLATNPLATNPVDEPTARVNLKSV